MFDVGVILLQSQISAVDSDVVQFEQKLDHWLSSLKQNILVRFDAKVTKVFMPLFDNYMHGIDKH